MVEWKKMELDSGDAKYQALATGKITDTDLGYRA